MKRLLLLALVLCMSCATAGFDPPADFGKRFAKDAHVGPYVEPVLLAEAEVRYSEDAKRNLADGTVRLKVWLDEHGVIQGIRVIQRAGYGLDEAAVEALKNFRFRPAQDAEGNSVPYVFVYTFQFSID